MAKKSGNPDIEFIDSLAELLRKHDLTEIDITRTYNAEEELTVRVARKQDALIGAPLPAAPAPKAPLPAAAPQPAQSPSLQAAPADKDDGLSNHPGAVKSPMVGTSYLSPEPTAPAFVNVGDKVEQGQNLLIIEAMKTMNYITAPQSGTITRILVENAAPIEFDQILMVIE